MFPLLACEFRSAPAQAVVNRLNGPAHQLILHIITVGYAPILGDVKIAVVACILPTVFLDWLTSLCCNVAQSRQFYFPLFLLRDPYFTARRSALAIATLSVFSLIRKLAFMPASL